MKIDSNFFQKYLLVMQGYPYVLSLRKVLDDIPWMSELLFWAMGDADPVKRSTLKLFAE